MNVVCILNDEEGNMWCQLIFVRACCILRTFNYQCPFAPDVFFVVPNALAASGIVCPFQTAAGMGCIRAVATHGAEQRW